MASPKKPKVKQKGLKKHPKTSNKSFSLQSFKREQVAAYLYSALSIFFIFVGATFIFLAATNTMGLDLAHPFLEQERKLSYSNEPKANPSILYIPKLSRALKVSEGTVVNGRWTISPTGVSFYTASATPGTTGNSVIYGHNLANILGDLYLVDESDPIYVVLSSGNIVKYQVFEEKEVAPQSVEILNSSQDSLLTLYTCSGFLDSARFVVIAKRSEII